MSLILSCATVAVSDMCHIAHNVFRGSWYWLTYNWLMFVTVKIIWNRSCKEKWNTRFIHSTLGVSGYWEVSGHASTVMPWLHFLIFLLFTLYVDIFQWYFLNTFFDWSYKMEIFCCDILNLFYFIFMFCLWALYFIAVDWNKCLLQLWNSWEHANALGADLRCKGVVAYHWSHHFCERDTMGHWTCVYSTVGVSSTHQRQG